MKFNVKALALACAVFCGCAFFVVALANLAVPSYAQSFLEIVASWYPGYHANHSIAQAAVLTFYAAADGLIGGALFGWLYNLLAKDKA